MGSCVFQCDIPHQVIVQRQVGPVSVYCDWVGCRVLCLRHGIPVWQHIGQSTTATSRESRYDLRCLKATLNSNKQTNKQTILCVNTNKYIHHIHKLTCHTHTHKHVNILNAGLKYAQLIFLTKLAHTTPGCFVKSGYPYVARHHYKHE